MRVCRMNYIIDGHNLIAKIPGLDLSMLDDEQRLIELLNRYGQHSRGRIEVYFDRAPVGQAGAQNYGRVRAHFVPQSQTADDAIRVRLIRLGRAARNWVVITSDRSVQAAGREAHAGVMSAEEFARMLQANLLQASLRARPEIEGRSADEPISEAEVNEWLTIFKERGKPK
jgi:predicted RNA-binding protein with PIN domain